MEKVIIHLEMVLSILVIMLIIRSMVLLKSLIKNTVLILVKSISPIPYSIIGFYENGRRHGEGTFTYENGDTYSGWWKYGVKCGKGTYTYASTGMRLFGEWEDN